MRQLRSIIIHVYTQVFTKHSKNLHADYFILVLFYSQATMAMNAIARADLAFAHSLTLRTAKPLSKQRVFSVKTGLGNIGSHSSSSHDQKTAKKLTASQQWRQSSVRQVRYRSVSRCQATAVPEPSGVPDSGGELEAASQSSASESKRYRCGQVRKCDTNTSYLSRISFLKLVNSIIFAMASASSSSRTGTSQAPCSTWNKGK